MSRRDFYVYLIYVLAVLLVVVPHYTWNITLHDYLETPLSPMFHSIEWFKSGVSSLSLFIQDRKELLSKVSRLKKRNIELHSRIRNLQLFKRKYNRLRDDLQLPGKSFDGMLRPVEVVQTYLTEWERTVRVSVGQSPEFSSGAPVLVSKGDTWVLLGEVQKIRHRFSTVILSSDPRFNVGVTVQGVPRRQFVARGSGYNGLRVEHFPRAINVPLNATVRTAPASSIAPSGLLVGIVRNVTQPTSRPKIGNVLHVTPALEIRIPPVVWVLER